MVIPTNSVLDDVCYPQAFTVFLNAFINLFPCDRTSKQFIIIELLKNIGF